MGALKPEEQAKRRTCARGARRSVKVERVGRQQEQKTENGAEAPFCKRVYRRSVAPQSRTMRSRKNGQPQLSILRAEMNASCGMSTLPNWRIFFLPAFCLSKSFRFRVASPP